MKKLCVIGEALIDFIPEKKGMRLKDVSGFQRVAGGAPANVGAAVSKLGGKAKLVTQLGQDAFGDHIVEVLEESGIDTSDVFRTSDADTSLAFVSLANDGNRDFKFYRRTCADKMLAPSMVSNATIEGCHLLHFCSVSLVECPMKHTHTKLIELALAQQMIISFDPNVRLSLWDDENACKQTIRDFFPYAHIVKISDEELEFISGESSIEKALPFFFQGNARYVIYTMGGDGACIYRKDGTSVRVPGHQVEVRDTTGAGDSFIGAFLYKLLEHSDTALEDVTNEELQTFLEFANAYAAHTTTKEGAIGAMATQEELALFIRSLT